MLNDSGAGLMSLKHNFEEIRVPLAKFQLTRRSDSGYGFAWPVLLDGMIGWKISHKKLVSRKYLSDSFLLLLNELS